MSTEGWIAVATNAIVIAGWFVIFKQTVSIKNRDELKSVASLSHVLIDKIYFDAIDYYDDESDQHINHKSARIRSDFVYLSHTLIVFRSIVATDKLSVPLLAFRMHAMGGHFETQSFKMQNAIPDWKNELANSASELKFKIDQAYFIHAKIVDPSKVGRLIKS